ncbi:MAG: hypothetical protein ACKV22_33545 [Bryobacteraceae bacterium]
MRRLSDAKYCSDAHRADHSQEMASSGLARLLDNPSPAKFAELCGETSPAPPQDSSLERILARSEPRFTHRAKPRLGPQAAPANAVGNQTPRIAPLRYYSPSEPVSTPPMTFEPEPMPFPQLRSILPDARPPAAGSLRRSAVRASVFPAVDDAATWLEDRPLAPMWLNLGLAVGGQDRPCRAMVGLRMATPARSFASAESSPALPTQPASCRWLPLHIQLGAAGTTSHLIAEPLEAKDPERQAGFRRFEVAAQQATLIPDRPEVAPRFSIPPPVQALSTPVPAVAPALWASGLATDLVTPRQTDPFVPPLPEPRFPALAWVLPARALEFPLTGTAFEELCGSVMTAIPEPACAADVAPRLFPVAFHLPLAMTIPIPIPPAVLQHSEPMDVEPIRAAEGTTTTRQSAVPRWRRQIPVLGRLTLDALPGLHDFAPAFAGDAFMMSRGFLAPSASDGVRAIDIPAVPVTAFARHDIDESAVGVLDAPEGAACPESRASGSTPGRFGLLVRVKPADLIRSAKDRWARLRRRMPQAEIHDDRAAAMQLEQMESDPAPTGLAGRWQSTPALARGLLLALPLTVPTLFYARLNTSVPVAGGSLASMKEMVRSRATVMIEDEFRGGLGGWTGEDDWGKTWKFDQSGSVLPASLGILDRSRGLTDYRAEFAAQIEKRSMGFALRASDTQNYYAVQFVVTKPGPLPEVRVLRYPVVKGRIGSKSELPIPLSLRPDTLYQVLATVRGDQYTVSINGQVVDTWSDPILPTGGVGFFAEKGASFRLRWVRVVDKDDFLGWICSQFSPNTADSKASR